MPTGGGGLRHARCLPAAAVRNAGLRAALHAGVVLVLSASTVRAAGLRVVVPERHNLQFMVMWVASGAGYLRDAGLSVEWVVPDSPAGTLALLADSGAHAAVLPPPMYTRLVSEGAPWVLVANLLRNDPLNLVVHPRVAVERGLVAGESLHDRLGRLRGLKLGVAPGPPTRLRRLFKEAGLDASRDVVVEIIPGEQQNDALRNGNVDALFCHTPYLERALVDDGAVMLVHASAGEVASLRSVQIHGVAVTRDFLQGHPEEVQALVGALQRAMDLLHSDRAAALAALLADNPALNAEHARRLLEVYAGAVPDTAEVSVEGTRATLQLGPAHAKAVSLDGVNVAQMVDNRFAVAAAPRRPWRDAFVLGFAGLVLLGLVGVAWVRRRATRRRVPTSANP